MNLSSLGRALAASQTSGKFESSLEDERESRVRGLSGFLKDKRGKKYLEPLENPDRELNCVLRSFWMVLKPRGGSQKLEQHR